MNLRSSAGQQGKTRRRLPLRRRTTDEARPNCSGRRWPCETLVRLGAWPGAKDTRTRQAASRRQHRTSKTRCCCATPQRSAAHRRHHTPGCCRKRCRTLTSLEEGRGPKPTRREREALALPNQRVGCVRGRGLRATRRRSASLAEEGSLLSAGRPTGSRADSRTPRDQCRRAG